MLIIKTYINKSPIHGIGVFAAEDVDAGALLWEFNPLIDKAIPEAELDSLPAHVKEWVIIHAWLDSDGNRCIGLDDDKYINHSDNPNTQYVTESNTFVSLRDIKKDEELTEDYTEYSISAFAKSLKN